MLAQLADDAAAAGVKIGVETHDEFASATTVARALALAPSPAVGAVWDCFTRRAWVRRLRRCWTRSPGAS